MTRLEIAALCFGYILAFWSEKWLDWRFVNTLRPSRALKVAQLFVPALFHSLLVWAVADIAFYGLTFVCAFGTCCAK